MKKFFVLFLFLIALAGCSSLQGDSSKETVQADVIHVVDGDTIDVEIDGKEEKVRFLLVDTPETVHPTKPVQAYGREASDYTKEQLEGKTVELEFDQETRDRYGRLLAYVYINGEMINEKLLEKGYARVTVYDPNDKYESEFRSIQDQAVENHLGIWSLQ